MSAKVPHISVQVKCAHQGMTWHQISYQFAAYTYIFFQHVRSLSKKMGRGIIPRPRVRRVNLRKE